VIVKLLVAVPGVGLVESVTVTLKLGEVPTSPKPGVPEMIPVEASRLAHAGSPLDDQV
jgi:hypothetical protein